MDSETTTNRKGFLKRAGLAIATLLAVSSTTRMTTRTTSRAAKSQASSAAQGRESRAMARVRTAKGAVARKA